MASDALTYETVIFRKLKSKSKKSSTSISQTTSIEFAASVLGFVCGVGDGIRSELRFRDSFAVSVM
ncbi:unnamed protein product [Rhodiola kirilowii]